MRKTGSAGKLRQGINIILMIIKHYRIVFSEQIKNGRDCDRKALKMKNELPIFLKFSLGRKKNLKIQFENLFKLWMSVFRLRREVSQGKFLF